MSLLFLTEQQIHDLLDISRGSLRDYALLNLAASTALRSSDLLKLHRSSVLDGQCHVITRLRTRMKKTGKIIERPLREDCRQAIQLWLESRKDDNPYLFISQSHNDSGFHLNRRSYERIIKKYLSQICPTVDLHGCASHTLRRSIGKLVYKKLGKIEPVTVLLGHTTPTHTMRYIDAQELQSQADNAIMDLGY